MASKKSVLVTTESKGVFFGYLVAHDATAQTAVITQARNCLYWTSDVKGFLGLAVTGPSKSCRVGPAVPKLTLAKVTAIVETTEEAAKKWEDSPWSM